MGITVPIDGSQDSVINIRGLSNYSIPPWQSNPLLPKAKVSPSLDSKESPPPDSSTGYYTEGTMSEGSISDSDGVLMWQELLVWELLVPGLLVSR